MDFVFKNHNNGNGNKPLQSSKTKNENNRLLIDEILQLANAFNNDNGDGKFDDVITAIVDENGAIHLAEADSPTLLRIISSQPSTTEGQTESQGLAASNRNTASSPQNQLLLNRNETNVGDKFKYETSHHQYSKPSNVALDFDSLQPGSILLFDNKTQLVVLPDPGEQNNNQSMVLINYQQAGPSKTLTKQPDLLPEYIVKQQSNLETSSSPLDSNKPRQVRQVFT